jgi:hypothetical protein
MSVEVAQAPPEVKTPQELYKGQRSILILVIGMSGTGKTTALETLDPKETVLANVMGKQLPFPNADEYVAGKNLLNTASSTEIQAEMTKYTDYAYRPEVKQFVIDDGQYIMATDFMQRAKVTGYEKWNILALNIWNILVLASRLRPGLKVYFLTHEEADEKTRKMKTLGKLLDDKITPEGLSTIVLFSGVSQGEPGKGQQYFFMTQNDGIACAKSPRGMFPTYIPNDLGMITKRIDEYYIEKVRNWEDSKLKLAELSIRRK